MDRDEALRLLKGRAEGVKEWNRRREAGEEIPSLEGADFEGADPVAVYLESRKRRGRCLRVVDFVVTLMGGGLPHLMVATLGDDLRDADLHDTDLHGAKLRGANLENADLRGAKLNHANLRSAGLRRADLRGADLRGADLRDVNLRRADLRRADLQGANVRGADLRGARGYRRRG